MKVKMQCEYCGEPIHTCQAQSARICKFSAVFCCIGCRNNYREKYAGRIQSIVEQYKEMQKKLRN